MSRTPRARPRRSSDSAVDLVLDGEDRYVTTDGGTMAVLVHAPCDDSPAAKLGGHVDTLLVLDSSASMTNTPHGYDTDAHESAEGVLTGEDTIKRALEQLPSIVDETHVKHNVAFAWFGSTAGAFTAEEVTGYTPWMPLADAQPALLNLANKFAADKGSTNVEAAIKLVKTMVDERATDPAREAAMTHVVFVTDGDATSGARTCARW